MFLERPCDRCGKPLRKKYAAHRVPAVIYCNEACRYAVPSILYDEADGTCSALPPLCEGVGVNRCGTGHGYSAYHMGCTCQTCKEANRIACLRMRLGHYVKRGAGEPVTVEHGKASTYTNKGCRCDACRAAKSVQNAKRYA